MSGVNKSSKTQTPDIYERYTVPRNFIDLTNKRFHKLIVLSLNEKATRTIGKKRKYIANYWNCQCDCGNQKVIKGASLTSGYTKSCGCYHKEKMIQYRNNNIVGIEINNWKVLSRHTLDAYGTQWLFKCQCKCGTIRYITKKEIKIRQACNICNKNNQSKYKQYKEIPGNYWNHIIYSSKKRGIEISITIQQAYELFIKQNKKCALTDLDIQFKNKNNEQTASLDRIDSSQGYTINNVQWVHKHINKMKQNFSQDYFITICQKVYNKCQKILQK